MRARGRIGTTATALCWLSAALFLLLIPLVWLSHPQQGGAGADAAAGAH